MKERRRDVRDAYKIRNLFYINVFLSVFISVFVFCFYVINPESDVVFMVVRYTGEWPMIVSGHHYKLSVFMSAFLKTAPFFGLLWFILSLGKVELTGKGDLKHMFFSSLFFPFFYFVMVFFMLFYNHDITESGRFVKFISRNEYFLMAYFSFIHFFVSMLTYFLFLFPYVTYLTYRKR